MMPPEVKKLHSLKEKLHNVHHERHRIEHAKNKKNLKIERAKAKERLRAEQGYQTWRQKLHIWFTNPIFKHEMRNEKLDFTEGKAF
jgi:hypothetical protein